MCAIYQLVLVEMLRAIPIVYLLEVLPACVYYHREWWSILCTTKIIVDFFVSIINLLQLFRCVCTFFINFLLLDKYKNNNNCRLIDRPSSLFRCTINIVD